MERHGQILIQMTIISTTAGKNPIEKKKNSPHNQQKILKYSTQVQPQNWQNDLHSFSRQAIQHQINPSLYPCHQCWSSWSLSVLWRPRGPPRTNTKKRSSIHHWGLECERKKSGYTWVNRPVWLWRAKWRKSKTNWSLLRVFASKYSFSTTQEMALHMDINKHQYLNWLHSL